MSATPTTTPATSTPTPASTPTSSTSRHYVDKARLIQLVHDNPILWDCRLPNYKRADKSKTEQWNHLGVIFNVSGERVQRTFTSLREIFRRELNNEKLIGRRFKSKWEFYKSMSFLRDVIRERKPRERHVARINRRNQLSPSLNNPLSSSNGIDEYQYFAPNDPNNPSIQHQQQQQQAAIQNERQDQANNEASPATLATQINASTSVVNLLTQLINDDGVAMAGSSKKLATPILQQHQHDEDVDLVQASPTTSTSPTMYIKDEIEIPDDDDDDVDEEDSASITFNGEVLFSNNKKIKLTEANADSNNDKQQTIKLKRNYKHQLQQWKRNNKCDYDEIDDMDEDDDGSSVDSVPNKTNAEKHKNLSNLTNGAMNCGNDEPKAQLDLNNMNEQMSVVSGVNGVGGHCAVGAGAPAAAMPNFAALSGESEIKYRRHLVYTKFADFIVAKMDAMNEREADDLMDRMMLVIASKH